MATVLHTLRNTGVLIRLVDGKPGRYLGTRWQGKGILHSKYLRVGRMIIVGSTNWTSSSKINHEHGHVAFMSPKILAFYKAMEEEVLNFGEPMNAEVAWGDVPAPAAPEAAAADLIAPGG